MYHYQFFLENTGKNILKQKSIFLPFKNMLVMNFKRVFTQTVFQLCCDIFIPDDFMTAQGYNWHPY